MPQSWLVELLASGIHSRISIPTARAAGLNLPEDPQTAELWRLFGNPRRFTTVFFNLIKAINAGNTFKEPQNSRDYSSLASHGCITPKSLIVPHTRPQIQA